MAFVRGPAMRGVAIGLLALSLTACGTFGRDEPKVESDTDRTVGHITDAQLDWLSGQLDEGAVRDREFELAPALIATYVQAGAEPSLVEVLRTALGSRRAVPNSPARTSALRVPESLRCRPRPRSARR